MQEKAFCCFVSLRGCGVSLLWDAQNPVRHGPEQCEQLGWAGPPHLSWSKTEIIPRHKVQPLTQSKKRLANTQMLRKTGLLGRTIDICIDCVWTDHFSLKFFCPKNGPAGNTDPKPPKTGTQDSIQTGGGGLGEPQHSQWWPVTKV